VDEKRKPIEDCESGEIHRENFATKHTDAKAKKQLREDCRIEEKEKNEISQVKYGVYAGHVGNPNPPACMDNFVYTVAGIESLLACLDSITAWAPAFKATLTQAQSESDEATAAHTLKIPMCNHAQMTYESSFCSYHELLTDSCADYTSCYDNAVAAEAAEIPKVNATEGQLKTEWRAVKRILCLVRVLQAGQTEQQTTLDECLAATYPTTDLDIVYSGDVPDRASCDTSNVTIHPCETPWESNEYSSKPWYSGAPTVECVECTHLQTPTPVPTPVPTMAPTSTPTATPTATPTSATGIAMAEPYGRGGCSPEGPWYSTESGFTFQSCQDSCMADPKCKKAELKGSRCQKSEKIYDNQGVSGQSNRHCFIKQES